jgi:hypothetical protein
MSYRPNACHIRRKPVLNIPDFELPTFAKPSKVKVLAARKQSKAEIDIARQQAKRDVTKARLGFLCVDE